MNQLTRTIIPGLLLLLFQFPITASTINIAIIESQSFHEQQKMDENWQATALSMGYHADILDQSTLDQLSNFQNYDIIIVSSGLLNIPANRQETVRQFVASGKNAYIQSEFEVTHPGNETFSYVVDQLGGSFNWMGEIEGGIAPINVLDPISTNLNTVNQLNYFWYGTYGQGGEQIQPFLENNGLYWGFIFTPSESNYGKVMTTSDQDWIRISFNDELLENMLAFLVNSIPVVQPTIEIEQTSINSCPGEVYEFVANITDNLPEVQLQWQINGTFVNGANAFTFATAGLQDGDVVECVLTLSNDPTYVNISNPLLIAPILPLDQPTITVAATQSSYCENAEITFSANLSNTNAAHNFTYQWTINGQIVAGANQATFSTNGLASHDDVSCTLIFDNDCFTALETEADAINIAIETAVTPTLSINTSNTTICQGSTITFSASGIHWGNDPVFEWQIDGQTVGNNNSTFSTSDLLPGQVVTCHLSSSLTCLSTNQISDQAPMVNITMIPQPAINIAADATSVCTGTAVTFTATGTEWGNNPTLQWMIDGNPVSGSNAATFTTTNLTNGQMVSCALWSDATCSSANETTAQAISIEIFEEAIPSIIIEADNNQVCSGTAITFTATGTSWGAQPQLQWYIDGVAVGNNTTNFTTADLQDGQLISCSVRSSAECTIDDAIISNSIVSEIASLQLEIVEQLSETCGLANGLVEISPIGGVAPYTYTWSHGANEQFLTDLSAGDYHVEVSDATGCTATINVTIIGEEQPNIDALEIIQPICNGEAGSAQITLDDNGQTYTYQWVDEDNFIRSKEASIEGLDEGVYTLNVSNEFGCSASQTFEIRAESSLNLETTTFHQVVLGESTRLNAIVSTNSAVTFEWLPAEGLSCTDCEDPVVTPTITTVYTLIVRNEFGCSVEASVPVKVIPNNEVYIPNAFSPNGDGANDFFTAFGADHVASIKSMRIVDRWGSVLYDAQDLQINNEATGWDGTLNGKTLKTGVYIYVLEIQFTDGKSEIFQGDLTLIQ